MECRSTGKGVKSQTVLLFQLHHTWLVWFWSMFGNSEEGLQLPHVITFFVFVYIWTMNEITERWTSWPKYFVMNLSYNFFLIKNRKRVSRLHHFFYRFWGYSLRYLKMVSKSILIASCLLWETSCNLLLMFLQISKWIYPMMVRFHLGKKHIIHWFCLRR